MVEIMFGKSWTPAAEGITKSLEDASKTDNTKVVFTLYQIAEGNSVIYFLMPDLKKLSGDSVNPLTSLLFE